MVARWLLWYSRGLLGCFKVDAVVPKVVARMLLGGYHGVPGGCYGIPGGCQVVARWTHLTR